ncbi:MAG: circadian phase modifier CpmA, partial [Hyphomicrobiales bacterium]|nr:circadian phase modifier CpmA [Hyphomicrobiales bacterium]
MVVRMDWGREARTGIPEAVFAEGKTTSQIEAIAGLARERGRRLLFTRLNAALMADLDSGTRDALDYDPISRTAVLGGAVPVTAGGVGIVAAGTSDLPAALEARRTLSFGGYDSAMITDVGVAGLWRLIERCEELVGFQVVIAVAGMEGALFSVV